MDIFEYLKQTRPSYQLGLELLKHHQPKCSVLYLLELGYSKVNQNLLRIQLQNIANDIATKQQTASPQNTAQQSEEEKYKVIKRINKMEFAKTYNVFLNDLRSSNDKERYQAAKTIIESFENIIIPTQNDLKHYERHGHLPEHHYLKKQLPQKETDLIQRKLNLRTYISKYKNDPTKAIKVAQFKAELLDIINKENAH